MTRSKAKLAVFASHGGSNFQALVDACCTGVLKAEITLLICNNPKAFVIERARAAGITVVLLPDKKEIHVQEKFIIQNLRLQNIDFVILAGYMKKIPALVIEEYKNRILNIHPALLPKFGGQGMYGIHVHEAVLAAGDIETGVTIHLVSTEYDQGEVLAQQRVPVEKDDTPHMLQARVLQIEYLLYPKTINNYIKKFKC